MPPEIYFVRHGQSTWNLEGRVQGQRDEPVLTDLGRQQAHDAAEALASCRPATLVCSDLRRASQSADIIGERLGLPVTPVVVLREHDHGSLSGLLTDEALRVWGVDPDQPFDPDLRQGGDGESTRDVAARAAEFYASVADRPGPIVAVTHGAFIQVAVSVALGEDLATMPWRSYRNGEIVRADGTLLGCSS